MSTVITYGTFDLLHVGHIHLLRRARALGERLIVAVSTDEFNFNMKNKVCVMPFEDRRLMVESLRFVDLVIKEERWDQKVEDVLKYKVSTFVIGNDWEGKFDFLKPYCNVVYLPRTANISTTDLKCHISSGHKSQLKAVF